MLIVFSQQRKNSLNFTKFQSQQTFFWHKFLPPFQLYKETPKLLNNNQFHMNYKNYQSELDLQSQFIHQQLQTIDKLVKNQNIDYQQLTKHNHIVNQSLINCLTNFINYQEKWNRNMVKQVDGNRKYILGEILGIKELVIGKIQFSDISDYKIKKNYKQKGNKQLRQKQKVQNNLFKENINQKLLNMDKSLNQISQQIKNIKQQINKFDQGQEQEKEQQFKNQKSKIMEEQSNLLSHYRWLFQSPQWFNKVYKDNDTILSLKNNVELIGRNFLDGMCSAKFKIERMRGQIRLGFINCEKIISKYIYYSTLGYIHDDTDLSQPKKFPLIIKEGDIIQIIANREIQKFKLNVNVKNNKNNKIDEQFMVGKYNSRKWKFYMYFQKKGDSLILLK